VKKSSLLDFKVYYSWIREHRESTTKMTLSTPCERPVVDDAKETRS